MTIVKNLVGAVIALVGMLYAVLALGLVLPLVFGVCIAIVATALNAAERVTMREQGHVPRPRYNMFGAVMAITTVWGAIMLLGTQSIGSSRFGAMVGITIIATAVLLNLSRTSEGERQ
jgi:hypothetical protein